MVTLYAAHTLPQKGDHLTLYADKYSDLRIKALRQSPEKFSGSIGDEIAMTKEERLARLLQGHRRVVIVAIQSDKQNWLEEEWVGSVNILGPKNTEEYFEPFSIHPQDDSIPPKYYTFENDEKDEIKIQRDVKAFYHMTALFVEANHRRRGIAKLLCERSFQLAIEQSQQADMRIFIAPDNYSVIDMYKRLGFKTANQKVTLAEALKASDDPLPAVFNIDKKYNTRRGVTMIRHLG